MIFKQLDMELVGGCNYRCRMCPQSTGREPDFLKILPLDVFKKIVGDAMQYGLESVSLHGGGEPLLQKNIAEYIRYVKSKGLKCVSFTNGSALTVEKYDELSLAGLDLIRVSAIGYDEYQYDYWMQPGKYNITRNYVKLAAERGGTEIHLYHLLCSGLTRDKQIKAYQKNWTEYTGVKSEIWEMHNWAGMYENFYRRGPKRSCGRPAAPILQVRAGGQGERYGAVVACCMVLGQDSKATLGHLDTQSIKEIYEGESWSELRKAHKEERFDDIDYCKNCDQLFDDPEVLVWTNIEGREYGQSKITDINFRDYK